MSAQVARSNEAIPNEAINLYELGVDVVFDEERSVALDSSLGLVRPGAQVSESRCDESHPH